MSSSALRETTPTASSDTSYVQSSPRTAPGRPSSTAASTAERTGPWYRREPWLAVTLSAFLPVSVGFLTPQSMHMPLLALAALLVLVAIGLLVRQGATR